MPEQYQLDLGHRPALGREAFLVSSSNAAALAAVEDWRNWPGGKLILSGPPGAGKTHLAHVWAELTGAPILAAGAPGINELDATALVIEDLDRIAGKPEAEERVFHLHNAVLNRGGRLLLTGVGAPSEWGLRLPDLASRVQAAGLARLEPPDEALLAGILVKLFADRQIRAGAQLVGYLTKRIERSIPAAEAAVDALDRAALAEGSPVTTRLAARVLNL